jgi:hypothetical protein
MPETTFSGMDADSGNERTLSKVPLAAEGGLTVPVAKFCYNKIWHPDSIFHWDCYLKRNYLDISPLCRRRRENNMGIHCLTSRFSADDPLVLLRALPTNIVANHIYPFAVLIIRNLNHLIQEGHFGMWNESPSFIVYSTRIATQRYSISVQIYLYGMCPMAPPLKGCFMAAMFSSLTFLRVGIWPMPPT